MGVLCYLHFLLEHYYFFSRLDSLVMIPTLDVSLYTLKIIDSFPFAILFQESPISNGCRHSLV